MKKVNDVSDRRFATVKWNLLLLAVVFFIFLISLIFIHSIVVDNARRMGSEITFGYSAADEYNWEVYQTLLTVGSEYVEEMTAEGTDSGTIETWISDYIRKMQKIAGNSLISPYAVINGRLIMSSPWENVEEYDVYQSEWYKKADGAEGRVVYTDVYQDMVHDRPVITVAKECGDTGNVIAFDIIVEDLRVQNNGQELPAGSTYYVCDSRGNLLYKEGGQGVDEAVLEKNFPELYQKVKNDELQEQEHHYYDAEGERMEVYYREAPNGWTFILCIPNSYLNRNWNIIIWMYVLALLVSLGVVLIMWTRESIKSNEIRKVNETVHILGNSYYAYYKVNIRTGTYEMIRGSDYVREHLKPQGEYSELLELFRDIIIEEEYPEFLQSFSLENIHFQLGRHIKDFGGDFRRLFDGEYKWVNVRMLFSPSVNTEEIVLCFRMVEDEKQWQLKRMELLEEALRAANASENSQKQFFSNISHDMRTPLNVIIGMSEMAGKCMEDPKKVSDYLQKINFSSKQLLSLINDILEMSRLEQGPILENKQFNIRERMEESVNVFRTSARRERKEIIFNCAVWHEVVYGDVQRLVQIVNNLMSNALKFTRPGDRISVGVREIDSQEHAKYQITVEDTGVGMSEEFLKHIFVPYEREKRFGEQSAEGTGLGMPIVKNLVSLMGGEITVQSELDRGSLFTVTLPFEPVVEEVNKEVSTQEEADKKELELRGRTILLAEDYALNMELTTDILELNGSRVIQAWNGKEALELFEKSEEYSIDAILMDMQMPEMDGCEAARLIRGLSRKDAESVPIIALTANAFSEDIARTFEAGMNAHICKPLDVKVLCDTLQKWMREITDEKHNISSR